MSDSVSTTKDTRITQNTQITKSEMPSRYAVEKLMAHYPKLDYLMAETLLWAHENNLLDESKDA